MTKLFARKIVQFWAGWQSFKKARKSEQKLVNVASGENLPARKKRWRKMTLATGDREIFLMYTFVKHADIYLKIIFSTSSIDKLQ